MKKWVFAKELGRLEDLSVAIPSTADLYREALLSRESKQTILQEALSAALENLMSWERVARAWGFEVEVRTDTGLGKPRPVFEGNTVSFVQSYGVRIRDAKKD